MTREGTRIISRKHIGLLVRAVVTIGALWYVIGLVPMDDLSTALVMASGALLLAGILCQVALRFVNALRIRIIARAQGAPLTYRAIVSTLFTTAFYALMLPGNIGAGTATLVKYVGHGATVAAGLVSMVVNRAIETGTTVAMGLFFWGLDSRASGGPAEMGIATALIYFAPVLLLGYYLALFGRIGLLQRFARLLHRPGLAEGGALRRGLSGVLQQLEAAGTLRKSQALAVGALSIAKELIADLGMWSFSEACGVELGFVTVAWMQAATALLVLLPITLSGLGVREGALVLMSARYGVLAPMAVIWALLMFGSNLVMASIGGLIEARGLWRRKAGA